MIARIGDDARLSGTCGYRTTTDLSTGKAFRWNATAFLPLPCGLHIQVPARSSPSNLVTLPALHTPLKVLVELNPGVRIHSELQGHPEALDTDSPPPRAAIRMTAERFRQALDVLAMNSRDMAGWINADDRTVRRWASGKLDIPQDVSDWLEGLTAYLEQNPRPQLRAKSRVA